MKWHTRILWAVACWVFTHKTLVRVIGSVLIFFGLLALLSNSRCTPTGVPASEVYHHDTTVTYYDLGPTAFRVSDTIVVLYRGRVFPVLSRYPHRTDSTLDVLQWACPFYPDGDSLTTCTMEIPKEEKNAK